MNSEREELIKRLAEKLQLEALKAFTSSNNEEIRKLSGGSEAQHSKERGNKPQLEDSSLRGDLRNEQITNQQNNKQ